MNMKKSLSVLLALSLMLTVICGAAPASAEGKKISVVATIFPIYDWVREIIGDDEQAEVTLLLDSGTDLHSYQPTASDILTVSSADLFIYVGGESDEWVEDVRKTAVNANQKTINLLEALGDAVKTEEIVECMEHEHDHDEDDDHDEDEDHDHDDDDHEEDHDDDHDEDDHDDHDHEHEDEADEHVWLSLRNAEKLCGVIAETLGEIQPESAAKYQENLAAYTAKLAALDAAYTETVSAAAYKTVLFGDRFPFRYLVDDYGLDYYAAFSGCSAETEASFATILFLAQKVDELGLPAVLTIEKADTRIAQTVVSSTKAGNAKILAMDSMQGTTAKDVQDGVTYLSMMEKNLGVLQEALN